MRGWFLKLTHEFYFQNSSYKKSFQIKCLLLSSYRTGFIDLHSKEIRVLIFVVSLGMLPLLRTEGRAVSSVSVEAFTGGKETKLIHLVSKRNTTGADVLITLGWLF